MLGLPIVFLFLLEEFFHRKLGRAGRLPLLPASTGVLTSDFDRFDLLRLIELVFIGLLFSTSAGSAATTHGQFVTVLAGLQVARLLGRRILSRWSVLGIVQIMEMILLLSVLFIPVDTRIESPPLTPLSVLTVTGGVLFGIFTSISAAFSISYGVRLFAREASSLYNTFPPLTDSEGWALRFSHLSVAAGITGAISLALSRGLSVLLALFSLCVLLQIIGVLLCRRKTFNGHHPTAHILWVTSFVFFYMLTTLGMTSIHPAL